MILALLLLQIWTPERFWSHRSGYVGARVCETCHGEIAARQGASHHAGTLRPGPEVPQLRESAPLWDRAYNAELRFAGAALISKTATWEQRLELVWAFGSGFKGITPVGKTPEGHVESRLSWYAAANGTSMTTGTSKQDAAVRTTALGRKLDDREMRECFGCHTTRIENGVPAELGVRCERCHGPGAEHVKSPAKGNIFVAAKLDGFRQAQVCGVCHGRPPQETDFAAIRFIEQTPNTARFPSQRLVLSRCFNETDGGLRCTLCHDPHANVDPGKTARDRACSGCHAPTRAGAKLCKVAKEDCSRCHMPKQPVMAHSLFTDHWIRVPPQVQ